MQKLRKGGAILSEIANKWTKFTLLKRHSGVMKHIPVMMNFSESNMRKLIDQFSYIVAKPLVGTGGHGVVKVEKNHEGYSYHYNGTIQKVSSWKALVSGINRIRNGRRYMLQQGIQLSTINGRRVDYRVKIVKKGAAWVITAVVGRLARPGLFVTNLCRGGTLLKGNEALRRTFPARLVQSKKATMCGVARTCTHLLESQYPGIGSLGFDFGIDRKGSVWILEVNTRPH
jgi:hypothetical protein